MKTLNKIYTNLMVILTFGILGSSLFLYSCEKDDPGFETYEGGTPKITKVTLLDTIPSFKDSSIVGAEPYKLLVISGENIGNIKKVFFNGYDTPFNPTYNTNTSLIIRLPAEAPTGKKANNELKLITSSGETTFGFMIVAKAAVYESDKIVFGGDRGNITLKGKNFEDVTKVTFSGTNTEVEILSRTIDKIGNETMVLKFPKTNLNTVTLDITNSSGVFTARNFEYINLEKAFVIFDDDYAKDFNNNSWGDPFVINSEQVFAGKKSISKTYAGGNWHLAAFSNWWPSVEYNPEFKYIVFAIRGGSSQMSLWLTTDASKSGFGNFEDKNKIEVAANSWNFYKIKLSDIDFWSQGSTLKQLGWRVKGPDKTETLYFDDVMFVK